MPDLRELVREILIEVLDSLPERQGARIQRECVALDGNADLNAFARSLVERAQDRDFADAVRAGRHVFDWEPRRTPAAPVVASVPAEVAAWTKALITERDLAQLGPQQKRLRIGSRSRLTPLAADELRRRGVKIERMQT